MHFTLILPQLNLVNYIQIRVVTGYIIKNKCLVDNISVQALPEDFVMIAQLCWVGLFIPERFLTSDCKMIKNH